MSTRTWRGGTAAVSQLVAITPANVEVGDTFTLTVTGEDGSTATISFVATAATVANVTAGLVAAWNGAVNPLVTPVTAADLTTALTLTADTAGVPFFVATSTTNGGSSNTQTLVASTTTASQGPNDWAIALNWVEGAVPVASDDVVLTASANDILYNLDQHTISLTSLTADKSFSGKVGQSSAFLKIGVTGTATIGAQSPGGTGSGSNRFNLNFGTTTPTVNVLSSSSAIDVGQDPVRLTGGGTIVTMNITGGNVSLAGTTGNTMTITNLNVVSNASNVFVGPGATITTVKNSGGLIDNHSTSTTTAVTNYSGIYNANGTGAHTTINAFGGRVNYNGTGTITTLNLSGAAVDFSQDLRAKTVTNCNTYSGASLTSHNAITYSNGIAVNDCDLPDVTLKLGPNVKLALTYL